jgi:hypothetical protein
MIHHRMSRHWLIFFTSTSSTLSQSTKKKTFICKASTQTSTNAIILIVRTSITSSINNIVVNRSIIVTIVNSWLILVLAIDFRFVFSKSALYEINQIADQSITRKKNAKIRKSALRIVIQNENHIQNFNVAWNNSLLKLKIIREIISLLNFSKNWSLTSTSRSLISSLKKSTANRKFTSSLSTRSMTRRQSLQLSSCLLTRHLNTD